jgi:hypothetical protein
MPAAISIQLDERLRRFVEHLQESKRVSPGQATKEKTCECGILSLNFSHES